MKEKFEKNVQSQLSKFDLEPSPQVWQEIEFALDSRRKDRKFIWWWLPALGLLLASVGWWFFSQTHKIKNIQKLTVVKTEKLNDKNSNTNEKEGSNGFTTSIAQKENNPKEKAKSKKSITNNDMIVRTPESKSEKRNISKIQNSFIKEENDLKIMTNPAKPIDSKTKTLVHSNNKETSLVVGKIASPKIIDTASYLKKYTPETTISKTDSSFNNVIAKQDIPQKKKRKKQSWFISIGGGSLHVNHSNLFQVASANQYSSIPGGQPGSSNPPAAVTSPSLGLNLYTRIGYQYQFGKRWLLKTGLQYSYFQNKQQVGTDSLASNGISYFKAGDLSNKINYAHWLQLPIAIGFTFNPSLKNKFQFFLGGSLAWSFKEKWLVTDASNLSHPYYYNTSLNNHAIINLNAGIGYNFGNHFQISLLAEQSLTPIHRIKAEKKYWRRFSLQIEKPLIFHKKKSLKK